MRAWLCAAFLLLNVAKLPVRGQEAQPPLNKEALHYEGRVIDAIQFEPAAQPLTVEELKSKLPLRPGSQFREAAVREAIQRLFATGRYSDIAVDAADAGQHVVLRFLTKPAYFVGKIEIAGVKQPPNTGQLASSTKLRLGTPYHEQDKTQALDAMRGILRQNGFYHAAVDAQVVLHSGTESADLTFEITPGKRARFTEPVITGSPGRSKQSIIRSTRWKRLYGFLGWQEVTEARVRQGLDRLRHDYEKRDRVQSSVTLTSLDYYAAENVIEPELDVAAGPRIAVKVEGANISRARLHELVPVFQEKSIDSDLLSEGQRNLAQYLQAEGYFEAAVNPPTQSMQGPSDRTITYKVVLAKRHKLVYLNISGNHYFPKSTIRERLYVQTATFPRFPYGRFSAAYLKEDIQAVKNLYAANGFRNVQVIPRISDNYRGRKNQLALYLTIEEGPQWHVAKLSVEGAHASDVATLQLRLESTPGQPFSSSSLADDRNTILNYFYSRGFLNATFEFFESSDASRHQVEIRYVVKPGRQQFVRDILVSGLETTRTSFVYRRIGLQQGAPLSLTEETDTQRRLYDLGIFARVNTAIQNPDGEEDQKYVLYDIDEARHYSLNVGFGAQIARIGGGATSLDNPAGTTGFAPRLAVGLTRINFLGRAQTLGVQTAVSTIEQRAALTYFIPQFGANSSLSLTSTALIENSNDIRTYTAHRREASIQLGQHLSRAYTVQYRMVYRDVTLVNLKIDRLLVPLFSQPERLGLGEFSLIEDKRDDPADAHRGSYSTVNLSYAPTFLGSQVSFARGLFRNSTYHAFRHDLVFARSTQFGLITRLSGGSIIPLAERLYSGGSTSLRSFPDFQAGPRDLQTGFVLGGNASFVNNLELRFPLYGDNVRGVLFEDAGNVYSSLGAFSFRFRQRNLQDFNYMVQSAGFGIRYQTPIGPIRLDFSYSPDAPRFFGLKGTLQDLINNTALSTVQKINAFQFHFSLGQAF